MFSLRFNLVTELEQVQFRTMVEVSKEAIDRLELRKQHSPSDYDEIMLTRQRLIENVGSYTPVASLNGIKQHLFPGTFYLQTIDKQSCRHYHQNV